VSGAATVLWHISISHYNEKARWTLDLKRVPHRRRAIPGGFHMPVALALTRGAGYTFPILVLDGEAIGDSTAIIGALEQRWPEPALYPEDPVELRRALDLEDYFDEQLGPQIRLLGWHELTRDPARLAGLMDQFLPPSARGMQVARDLSARFASAFTALRYGVRSEDEAERSRQAVLASLDRLEAELDGNEYLVGDRFTVADLTAASLFYPLVLPDEGPLPEEEAPPAGIESFREPLKQRVGYQWVEEMFRRHRRPSGAHAVTAASQD
jgi:glutathione S-transferase